MSAIRRARSPHPERTQRMRHRGFTLLEMIVVLAILGLAAALVGPSMVRSIDTWRRQAAMDALLDQLRADCGSAMVIGSGVRPPPRGA